jgi:hypothetical protein
MLGTRRAEAQIPNLAVIAPDTILSVTPSFFLQAFNLSAVQRPLRMTLQLSAHRDFSGPLLLDTTVVADSSVTISVPRPLPERITLFWRASAVPTAGPSFSSAVGGPRTTATWLTLAFPASATGTILENRRPQFVWRSAAVSEPPGPWQYEIQVINLGRPIQTETQTRDTTFVPGFDLDANTSYRWSVKASLSTGDSVRLTSQSTFVILDQKLPTSTIFYQNFPNPFPTSYSKTTCFWFDLGVQSIVSLDVFDLRGNEVRHVFPTSVDDPLLPPSRYGRAAAESDSGCDPRFSWDGTSDERRRLPAGVYLVRFRAGAFQAVKKIVLKDG